MSSKKVKRRLMLAARPSLRKHPRPPKARTLMGESFSMANFAAALVLQHCQECGQINYPSRERCRSCLSDDFRWRQADTSGEIVSCTQIHISQWEFFKRKAKEAPWPIASVKLAGQILFVHLAVETFGQLAGDSERKIHPGPPLQKEGDCQPNLVVAGSHTPLLKEGDCQPNLVIAGSPPPLAKGDRGGFKASEQAPLLPAGTKVKVFSQTDTAKKSVLIAVSEDTDIKLASQRKAIAVAMGISK